MALTEEQINKYLDGPLNCPYCGAEELDYGSVDMESFGAYQEVHCKKCGKRWADSYALVGIIEYDEEEEETK
jgi:transcription elongation factor Elf1